VGVTRGKKWRTTTPDPAAPPALGLTDRDFTATAPDQLGVADFTYTRTDQGSLYLAVVIDVFSRMIVGWVAHSGEAGHLFHGKPDNVPVEAGRS